MDEWRVAVGIRKMQVRVLPAQLFPPPAKMGSGTTKGMRMARKAKELEPITNACVAARHAADALAMCSAALQGIKALEVQASNPDCTIEHLRACIAIYGSTFAEARKMIDWS